MDSVLTEEEEEQEEEEEEEETWAMWLKTMEERGKEEKPVKPERKGTEMKANEKDVRDHW